MLRSHAKFVLLLSNSYVLFFELNYSWIITYRRIQYDVLFKRIVKYNIIYIYNYNTKITYIIEECKLNLIKNEHHKDKEELINIYGYKQEVTKQKGKG